MKCIYCLEDKPATSFTKTEHIIPQSFGLFKNNFTLNDSVCDDCNKYFGDNLEIDLGRDTYEGLARYEFGLKSPKEFKALGKRSRLNFKVTEGPYKGAYSYPEYSKEQDRIVCKPLPQVGFLNPNSDYEYFLLDEIPDKASLEQQSFDVSQHVVVLGSKFEAANKILSEKGFSPLFATEAELPASGPNDEWLFEVEGSIDDTISRAVAKIALNYLAYWEGPKFVLQSDFDPLRRYIRTGEKGTEPFIMIRTGSILSDEPEGSRWLGHIVTVNWAKDNTSIISQISLFNSISYTVRLAKNYSGQSRNFRRGHFFNLHNQEIMGLTAR